jgi:hypothetical protein
MKKLLFFVLITLISLVGAAIVALAVHAGRMNMVFLSNDWCTWFWQNFSTVLTALPAAVFGILQAIAIFHPEIETNGVISLVQKWLTPKETGPPPA